MRRSLHVQGWRPARAQSGFSIVCMPQAWQSIASMLGRAAAALKLQVNKTDRNDAHGLTQLVRSGWYDPTPMKSLGTYPKR